MADTIAGADGCRGGWVVVSESPHCAVLTWDVVPSLQHLFALQSAPSLLAIDIPIGLTLSGPRACDLEARRLLGKDRASSVFASPIRPMLAALSHTEASDLGFTAQGKRISIQAWAIVPKIREVDEFLRATPYAQALVHEVHPEVCFYFMAGRRPMRVAKKKVAGRGERATLLRSHFGDAVDSARADCRRLGCAPDDIIDAFVGLWTARRIRAGTAVRLPETPPLDVHGLRMEMLA